MIGIVSDIIKIFTPIFYVGIIFSPMLMKDLLFRKEKSGDDDKIVYIKILKKTNNLFANDVEKVLTIHKDKKIVFNIKNGDVNILADYIRAMIDDNCYVLTYTDKTYIVLKNILRNYISIDKTLIKHINFYDTYSYTYKENVPVWRKNIEDYKNLFEFILVENNYDLELLHTISK